MRSSGKRREEIFFNLWKFYPAKALEHRAFRAIAAPALRGRVLDIGGGLGPYWKYLSGVSYSSIEINCVLYPDLVGSVRGDSGGLSQPSSREESIRNDPVPLDPLPPS